MRTATSNPERFYPITPSESDALLAGKTSKRLLAALLKKQPAYPVQLLGEGQSADQIEIPAPAMRLLVDALAEMAQGHAVTLLLVQEEITTQQAADLLNVSRPYVVQLLEEGAIPFRKVGTRRRIRLEDVMRYKQETYNQRLQVLDELTAYDQELGLQ
jgi:excisionase family DNA binding protein